jgi:nucleotide-binding universal stress UspA family protein
MQEYKMYGRSRMSERILIPLDGSKVGEAALHYVEGLVERLAPAAKVEVTLFHAITTLAHEVSIRGGGTGGTVTTPYTDSELEQKKGEVTEYLKGVSEGLISKGATVTFKVAVGKASAEEIIKAEEEANADLVAMSTHGRHGLTRWAFGSVTEKVLRGGKVPVLMVRAEK